MSTQEEMEKKWTLENLKMGYESRANACDCFENVVQLYFNQCDSALKIITELNDLIDEYNEIGHHSNFSEAKEYKQCLFEALEISIPFLDTYSRAIAYVNMCILADDVSDRNFYDKYFRISLKNANDFVRKELELVYHKKDSTLYFRLGFLNFKAQQYIQSIHFLEECRNDFLTDKIEMDNSILELTECVIYLANSYEYSGRLSEAIKELIGVDEEKLKCNVLNQEEQIKQHIMRSYYKISKNCQIIDELKIVCQLFTEKDYYMIKIFDISDYQKKEEIIKTYIHILAHCMSEYVSKLILDGKAEYPYCSILQFISRFLMDWLVSIDDSYVTCQATIRAENDACPEAIDLLLSQYDRQFGKEIIESTLSDKQRKAKAELEFYIFYFTEQELRFNYEEEKLKNTFLKFGEKFRNYSEKTVEGNTDYDSLFHYWVIQCKYLLKKYAREALKKDENIDYNEIDEAFLQLFKCKRKISKHVFKGLTEECKRLESLYLCFRQFRYLNKVNVDPYNLNEFDTLIHSKQIKKDEKYESILGTVYHEIEKRNKIMILAPVYESPSCSFSVRDIKELITFRQKKSDALTGEVSNHKKSFRKIGHDHNSPVKKKKKFISQKNNNVNKVKWAFTYNCKSKSAFLYYKNFRKVDGEFSKELFPVILNNKEADALKELLEDLSNKLDEQPCIECDLHYNGKDHGDEYTCNTKKFSYMSKEVLAASESLLNLLIFLEMDFLSAEKELRLVKDDQVIVFYLPNEEGNQYSITVLPADFNIDRREMCEWCFFNDKESLDLLLESQGDNSSIPSEDLTQNEIRERACNNINFENVITNLETQITISGAETTMGKDLKLLKEKVRNCQAGNCSDKERQYTKTCSVLEEIMRQDNVEYVK